MSQVIHCPTHPYDLTPAQARLLALELVELADEAEGAPATGATDGEGVTRWDLLADLDELLIDAEKSLLGGATEGSLAHVWLTLRTADPGTEEVPDLKVQVRGPFTGWS